MKQGTKRETVPAAVAPFFVGRRVIITLDGGQKIATRIRTKPQRWPGGTWRTQVEGRAAWYNLLSLTVDTSNQLQFELVR